MAATTTFQTPGAWATPKKTQPINTPINGADLRNADINYNQYGDDSSAPNQVTPGGLNEKYTWEWVKNSQLDYNQNIKTWDLGDMAFWQQGQQANSIQANYLASRNDNIASALYNEWRTSKEDVISYLASQEWWNNSTEQDRVNTVEAVWKRLGDIAAQQNPEQWQEQVEQQTTEQNQQNAPEFGDQWEQGSWVIYGRASWDKNTKIKTNADPFSPDAISLRARQSNYQTLNSMDSYDLALVEASGVSLFGETAMRDLATYNPQKYQEIQTLKKQIQAWDTINAIASWEKVTTSEQTAKATDTVNSSIDKWVQSNSTARTSGQVQWILEDKLTSNQVANSATQEMLNLNKDIAELEERLENLPKEAKSHFKGDVPQYIVDAYVSNNSQKIQSELNKLQSRYNSALELYKTELSNTQREAEMELKQLQFESDENYRNWQMMSGNRSYALDKQQQERNQKYQTEKLMYDNIVEINGTSYMPDGKWWWTELTSDIAYNLYKNTVAEKLSAYNNMFQDGSVGWQCEAFTDAFTYSTTWLKMEWEASDGSTTAEEKKGYRNTWIPEVGSVAIFDYGIVQDDGVNYWHTMLVTDYDPVSWLITLRGSNKSKKEWEYERVYTQTMSLSELNSKGAFEWFWNPYLDKVNGSYGSEVIGWVQYNPYYTRANTPMTWIFDWLKTNASTAGQLTEIATWEFMYNTLYELESLGYLDKLAESWVIEDFINSLDRKAFWKEWDARGSAFFEQMWKFLRNEIKDEEVSYAMNRLYQIVEQKLREESWAAISSSEWAMDFQLFLPQPWQSTKLRKDQLKAWDDIVYKQLSWAWMLSYQYVPIFDYSESEEVSSSSRGVW